MNSIVVSVIVPCYNQGKFLAETLDSVKKQKHKEWECIIVDDGSTDNSKDIALSFCQQDKRFRYIYQENQGLAAARNNGIRNSNGLYILPLDSDDIIHEDYLSLAIDVLIKKPDIKVVYCRAVFFSKVNEEWILPEFSLEELPVHNCIFCSAIYRRKDYDQTIGYNPNMKYGLEDWDFWISLLKDGGNVYKIPKILFFYRKHFEDSMVDKLRRNDNRLSLATNQLVMNHPEFFHSQYKLLFEKYNSLTLYHSWPLFQYMICIEEYIQEAIEWLSKWICDIRIKGGSLRNRILKMLSI